jgi:hypothetical protein
MRNPREAGVVVFKFDAGSFFGATEKNTELIWKAGTQERN